MATTARHRWDRLYREPEQASERHQAVYLEGSARESLPSKRRIGKVPEELAVLFRGYRYAP
jgi:hypothetical protein